jgi:hypothetical protein
MIHLSKIIIQNKNKSKLKYVDDKFLRARCSTRYLGRNTSKAIKKPRRFSCTQKWCTMNQMAHCETKRVQK